MTNNSIAIVTGAAGGIGKEICNYLAKNQKFQKVVLLDCNEGSLDKVIETISDNIENTELIKITVDVRDNQKVNELINTICAEGSIELLVNCAGITIDGTSEISYNDFLNLLETNILGSFNTISSVLPYMKKQNSGYVVNIVSQAGKRARPLLGAYAASKFGILGYTEGLQKELSDTNINFTAICPGMVATAQTDDEKDIDKQDMLQPTDIVTAIDYLLKLPNNISIKELIIECKKQIHYKG